MRMGNFPGFEEVDFPHLTHNPMRSDFYPSISPFYLDFFIIFRISKIVYPFSQKKSR